MVELIPPSECSVGAKVISEMIGVVKQQIRGTIDLTNFMITKLKCSNISHQKITASFNNGHVELYMNLKLLKQAVIFGVVIVHGLPSRFRVLSTTENLPDYTVDFSGRLGNLMFEYAALLGVCIRAACTKDSKDFEKSVNITFSDALSCAKITNPNFYELETPITELISVFNLTLSAMNSFHHKNTYQEHPEDGNCIRFDSNVFQQPSGTKFRGIIALFFVLL